MFSLFLRFSFFFVLFSLVFFLLSRSTRPASQAPFASYISVLSLMFEHNNKGVLWTVAWRFSVSLGIGDERPFAVACERLWRQGGWRLTAQGF